MRKRLTANRKHASCETIKTLYISEKNLKIKTRLLTILHLFEGKFGLEVLKDLAPQRKQF